VRRNPKLILRPEGGRHFTDAHLHYLPFTEHSLRKELDPYPPAMSRARPFGRHRRSISSIANVGLRCEPLGPASSSLDSKTDSISYAALFARDMLYDIRR
jgi:hypothetical protein